MDELSGKPTLEGTTSTVPRLPRRRHAVVATAAVVCTGGLIASAVLLGGFRAKPKVAPAVASAPPDPPITSIEALPAPSPIPEVEAAEPVLRGSMGSHAGPHASHSSVPSPGGTSRPAAPGASAGPVAPAPAAPGVAPQPSPAPQAGGDGPSSPPADPSFDPASGYVEVGLINAQGVREPAVRGALHGVPLAACYRAALRLRGARVTGVAQLSLSIDEDGVTRSAIATGADFLQGLTRCVQTAAARVTVPRSRVDPGGGTADVTLAFKTP
jgi:hypothetical protein